MSAPTASLSYSAQGGIKLDLDGTIDGISVRFMGVSVPAEGLAALRKAPVALFEMDLLFSTHIDLGDAPGQLHTGAVQIDGDALVLSGELEDAETGQSSQWKARFALQLDGSVPEEGGTVLDEPAEDAFDFDDDEDDMAMPKGEGGGMEALLRTLMKTPPGAGDDDFDEPSDEALAALESEEGEDEDDDEDDTGMSSQLLAAILGASSVEPEAASQAHHDDDLTHAVNFLQLLVDREGLELEEGASLEALAEGAAPIILSEGRADKRATQLSNWLLDQPGVEELYIDDESLEGLLDQW